MTDEDHIELLAKLAEQRQAGSSANADSATTRKAWCENAETFTYHTHVTAPAGSPDSLEVVADTFYQAADLSDLPWYAQFRGGEVRPSDRPVPKGVTRHQLAQSYADVGLWRSRCYRMRVSDAAPRPAMRVVALRSVDVPWDPRPGSVLAQMLCPSGDVFQWDERLLHWHHIVTTPGIGLLPGKLDRWLLNGLRRFGLDQAERRTYREEAEAFVRWVASL